MVFFFLLNIYEQMLGIDSNPANSYFVSLNYDGYTEWPWIITLHVKPWFLHLWNMETE